MPGPRVNTPKPCGYPKCVAFALDGREHCPVHSPERIAARAKQIVINEFWSAQSKPISHTTHELLTGLLDSIVTELDRTL
jgi:hypothetical protein